MSVAFSTEASTVIRKEIGVRGAGQPASDEELLAVYELERCCNWIQENQYQRVALQFPDELLGNAAAVTKHLQHHTSAVTFILADTSYGSCCVDEVAAEHYSADAIIHFGNACLSPTRRLPVLFVFGRLHLDVDHCCQLVASTITGPLLLIYSVPYHHYRDNIRNQLLPHFPALVIAELDIPEKSSEDVLHNNDDENGQTVRHLGRCISLPAETPLSDITVCYIGEESLNLTNWILHFSSSPFYTYNPEHRILRQENLNVNRFMMKRYSLIEKAKDAQIVGLLVGTLGVADYVDILDRLRKLATDAGKKTYTFVVGKVNVPKLANFMEIDIYVLVACPENTLLDSSEFYRPIITPFEMEVACNQARDWTGKLVTDFRRLLPGGPDYIAEPENATWDSDVSLVTGRVRCMGVKEQEVTKGHGQLATQQTSLMESSAGAVLKERSWQGLEPKLGQTPVQKAKEGRRGIAMGYEEETSDKS